MSSRNVSKRLICIRRNALSVPCGDGVWFKQLKRRSFLAAIAVMGASSQQLFGERVSRDIHVTLKEAHKGSLEIDTRLLDSYGSPPPNVRQFYLDARQVFAANRDADFSDPGIVAAAHKHGLDLMGGPMLGDLHEDGVTLWLRPATATDLDVHVGNQTLPIRQIKPGETRRVRISGLSEKTTYRYIIAAGDRTVAKGYLATAPRQESTASFRITFGSCCHKIGVHNPNLFASILDRHPDAMLLLGDTAVDDRNGQVNLHRADYQLRDVSPAWQSLASRIPLYASWDDHDYFDNDLSGVPGKFSDADRAAVREVWHQNWNNPPADDDREGIYFGTRIGPVEIIMLDTRSCRNISKRGKYGSFLGTAQMRWLKRSLRSSTAPFKVISSGTMWSDYVSDGKDSWGTWDKEAREEIFQLIEQERISGVLFVSGDRHGARGFRIPRPSGASFYEFEPASMGGVSGPKGIVENCPEQLFGYDGKDQHGKDFVAFGEFTFEPHPESPQVTFRLIDQFGNVLEEHLAY